MILSTIVTLLMQVPPVPAQPAQSGGMDLNAVLTLLLGAGGSGALAGGIAFYRTWRKGKLDDEETLIARLNADSRAQGDRADAAERTLSEVRKQFDQDTADLRRQRDRALDQSAYYRSFLIGEGYRIPDDSEPRYG